MDSALYATLANPIGAGVHPQLPKVQLQEGHSAAAKTLLAPVRFAVFSFARIGKLVAKNSLDTMST